MSTTNELPHDDWHSHVYVNFSWLECEHCKREPDLEWAWANTAEGEQGVVTFTIRAVKHLKDEGWQFHDWQILCPECAAKRFAENAG